jgi:hypothetical protein
MGSFLVTNLGDAGTGSLRQVIIDANSTVGQDTIEFAGSLNGGTITLTSGELSISDPLIVNGLGANSLTINGNNSSRIFNISSQVDIQGLTITGGAEVNFGFGGGITNSGVLIINKSVISNNEASFGGGIDNEGIITILNSTISGNKAIASFAGIRNVGEATIINSTISGNQADFYAGGIFNSNVMSIANSTIANNSALNGGGIFSFGGADIFLNNTIIANSIGGDCVNINALGTNNLVKDGSCNASLSGDPLLGPLQNNGGGTLTHALLSGSGAIDAGDNASIPTGVINDQRGIGFPRIINGTVDIGAFEVQQVQPPQINEPSSILGLIAVGIIVIAKSLCCSGK